MTTTIKDLGEIELLNRLKKFMRFGQINDDVAEISTVNKSLLINTDLLIEKIHFSDEISNAKDVGWKCITTNISEPSITYPKAAFLPSIRLRPAGFNSASYKKKKTAMNHHLNLYQSEPSQVFLKLRMVVLASQCKDQRLQKFLHKVYLRN